MLSDSLFDGLYRFIKTLSPAHGIIASDKRAWKHYLYVQVNKFHSCNLLVLSWRGSASLVSSDSVVIFWVFPRGSF